MTMVMWRRLRLAALAVALGTVSSGCGGGGNSLAEPSPPPNASGDLLGLNEFVLPSVSGIYAWFPEITGPSTVTDRRGWVDLLELRLGQSTAAANHQSPLGAPVVDLIRISKLIDETTPALLGYLLSGRLFPGDVKIEATTNVRGRETTALRLDLVRCRVVSQEASILPQLAGVEDLELAFEQFTLTTYSFNADGVATGSTAVTYNLATNTTSRSLDRVWTTIRP